MPIHEVIEEHTGNKERIQERASGGQTGWPDVATGIEEESGMRGARLATVGSQPCQPGNRSIRPAIFEKALNSTQNALIDVLLGLAACFKSRLGDEQ